MPRTAFIMTLFIVVLSLPATAADKITVDPNTPGAQAAVVDSKDPEYDSRLDKKITFEAPDLPLQTILQNISKAGGVTMVPSSAPDNWQVRERTAMVFMNNAPLSEFKDAMAELFDYRWTRASEEKPWVYLLRETDKAKQIREDGLRLLKEEEIRQRIASIQKGLDDAKKSTKMTPAEIQEAKEKDPWMYYLATSPSGKLWAEFVQEVPGEWWKDVASGVQRYVPLNTPSSQHLQDIAEQICKQPMSAVSMPKPSDIEGDPRQSPIYMIKIFPQLGSGVIVNIVTGYKVNSTTTQPTNIDNFPLGPSQASHMIQKGLQDIEMRNGKEWAEAANAVWPKVSELVDAQKKAEEAAEKVDKDLLREIEHKPIADEKNKNESQMVQHLRGLARETGYTIVMETFTELLPTGMPKRGNWYDVWAPDKGTIYEVLKGLTQGGYTYEKRGNVIFVRHRDWLQMRTLELPKDLVKKWEDSVKAHGGLNFKDLCDIVEHTTYSQYTQSLTRYPLLRKAGIEDTWFTGVYSHIKLGTMLPEEQRKLYFSDAGVPNALLKDLPMDRTVDQINTLKEWIDGDYAKDKDTVMGVTYNEYGDNNPGYRLEIKPYARFSDGKVNQPRYRLFSNNDRKAFLEYVKQMEEEQRKKQGVAEKAE